MSAAAAQEGYWDDAAVAARHAAVQRRHALVQERSKQLAKARAAAQDCQYWISRGGALQQRAAGRTRVGPAAPRGGRPAAGPLPDDPVITFTERRQQASALRSSSFEHRMAIRMSSTAAEAQRYVNNAVSSAAKGSPLARRAVREYVPLTRGGAHGPGGRNPRLMREEWHKPLPAGQGGSLSDWLDGPAAAQLAARVQRQQLELELELEPPGSAGLVGLGGGGHRRRDVFERRRLAGLRASQRTRQDAEDIISPSRQGVSGAAAHGDATHHDPAPRSETAELTDATEERSQQQHHALELLEQERQRTQQLEAALTASQGQLSELSTELHAARAASAMLATTAPSAEATVLASGGAADTGAGKDEEDGARYTDVSDGADEEAEALGAFEDEQALLREIGAFEAEQEQLQYDTHAAGGAESVKAFEAAQAELAQQQLTEQPMAELPVPKLPPESELAAKPEPEVEPSAESEAEVEAAAKPEPEPELEIAAEVEAEPEPEPEVEPEPEPEPEVELPAEPEAEVEPAAKPEPEPELEAAAGAEAEAEPEPEVEPSAESEAEAAAKPEPEPELEI
eukprot:COSAG01_NODE_3807_length_5677_cov_7.965041_6_plen_569_part_01